MNIIADALCFTNTTVIITLAGVVGTYGFHVYSSVLLSFVGISLLFGGFNLNVGVDYLMNASCVSFKDGARHRGTRDTLFDKVIVTRRGCIRLFANDVTQRKSGCSRNGREIVRQGGIPLRPIPFILELAWFRLLADDSCLIRLLSTDVFSLD